MARSGSSSNDQSFDDLKAAALTGRWDFKFMVVWKHFRMAWQKVFLV
jgi:hypothetical protein